MIIAAGLTPAWQQILTFERLKTGHVNRAASAVWCGSGKVLNVGAALHHLQTPSTTVCPIGGATGDQIRNDFLGRGIQARWTSIAAPTRVCTTLLDQSTGVTTELVENASSMTASELEDYINTFGDASRSASTIVLTGSLPKDTPVDFYRRLMERCPVDTVMDVRGKELLECLPLRPRLVKPNREELAATVGRTLSSEQELIEAMDEVRRLGADWVLVSNGPDTLLAMGPEGLTRITPPTVKVINPIGCGDSLTAAIAARLTQGWTILDAIQFGVLYSARKAAMLFPVLREG